MVTILAKTTVSGVDFLAISEGSKAFIHSYMVYDNASTCLLVGLQCDSEQQAVDSIEAIHTGNSSLWEGQQLFVEMSISNRDVLAA